MAEEEIGARLSLKDRRKFSSEAQAAAGDIDKLGNATEGVSRRSRLMSASLGVAQGSIRGLTTVAKVGVASVAAIGTGIVALSLKGGIDRALNIEDATAKLTGLGHSASAVTDIMDSALASVKGTAFGLDSAATTAAGAVAAGIAPGKELTDYLKMTADTATIAGTELSEMGSILNKVQANGKAMTDNLNQLSDRGIPILGWLAEEYGVSTEAMSDMVSKGKVDAATFNKVLQENLGGAALKSGETLRGSLANMQAAFSRFGAGAVGGFLPLAKDIFQDLTVAVDAAAAKAVPSLERLGTGLTGVYRVLARGDYTNALQEGFGWEEDAAAVDKLFRIREGVAGLYSLLAQGDYTGNLGRAFGWGEDSGAVDKILSVRDAITGFDLGSTVAQVRSFFSSAEGEELTSSLGSAATSLGELKPALSEFIQQMPSISDVVTVAATVLGFLADNVDTLVSLMPLIVGLVVAYKVAQLASNLAVVAGVYLRIADIASRRQLTAALISNTAAQGANTTATNVGTAASARGRLATVGHWVAMGAASVAQGARVVGSWILMGVAAMASGVMMAAAWLIGLGPIGWAIALLVLIGAAFVTLWKTSETFRNIVKGALGAVGNAAVSTKDWIVNAFNTVVGFLTSLPGRISRATSNMWDGIKNAFRSAVNWIIDKWNGLSFTLPSIDTKIPGIGKVGGFTLNTPNIPRLHTGGTVTSGGAVNMLPGEEIVILPPAASVVPMSDDVRSMAAQASGGGGGTTVLQLVVDRKVLAEAVYDHTGDKVARR